MNNGIYAQVKRYATSESHRENNMKSCLSTIYWSIDPANFSIRR